VPHLIKVNQIFENTIQKNVVVPVINEVIKEIKVDKEKIIAIVSEIPQLR
jgi:ribosomal 30S subunit maturation factor RimM